MPFGYVVVERFDPSNSGWLRYVEWSGYDCLSEVVSLDCLLCPAAATAIQDADWVHMVDPEFSTPIFTSADYASERSPLTPRHQLLAVVMKPPRDVTLGERPGADFDWVGYDLIEDGGGVSALTNCGGFDGAFTKNDLNAFGLISSFARVVDVQAALKRIFPEEPHAYCNVVALWRKRG